MRLGYAWRSALSGSNIASLMRSPSNDVLKTREAPPSSRRSHDSPRGPRNAQAVHGRTTPFRYGAERHGSEGARRCSCQREESVGSISDILDGCSGESHSACLAQSAEQHNRLKKEQAALAPVNDYNGTAEKVPRELVVMAREYGSLVCEAARDPS